MELSSPIKQNKVEQRQPSTPISAVFRLDQTIRSRQKIKNFLLKIITE
jgi:hypothetical protein